MKTVYLDGVLTDSTEIDPAKHTFVGMFRPPTAGAYMGNGLVACPCGSILHLMSDSFLHWQVGHFDVPQYKTI